MKEVLENFRGLSPKTIEKHINATIYLALHVPAEQLNQRHYSMCNSVHCIAGWCQVSDWHVANDYLGHGGGIHNFMGFHGLTFDEAREIVLDNAHRKGEAARADVVAKLVKALEVRSLEVYT